MTMTKQELVKALENGEYKVAHESECNCSYDWHIEDDQLVNGVSSDGCWEGNILYIGDTAIAQAIRYDRPEPLIDGLSRKDIEEASGDEDIISDMEMSEMREQGESGQSEEHEEHERESLIEWLMQCGYELDRDDERNFSNEYTMILRKLADGATATVTRSEAEEWADQFLYSGDAATQAYNGFRFEEAENE
jgi:hypothetical protein